MTSGHQASRLQYMGKGQDDIESSMEAKVPNGMHFALFTDLSAAADHALYVFLHADVLVPAQGPGRYMLQR